MTDDGSAHDAMLNLGEQADPVREALRWMIAEFGDEHYHTCPADSDSGPCDCFAGHMVAHARRVLETACQTVGNVDTYQTILDVNLEAAKMAEVKPTDTTPGQFPPE